MKLSLSKKANSNDLQKYLSSLQKRSSNEQSISSVSNSDDDVLASLAKEFNNEESKSSPNKRSFLKPRRNEEHRKEAKKEVSKMIRTKNSALEKFMEYERKYTRPISSAETSVSEDKTSMEKIVSELEEKVVKSLGSPKDVAKSKNHSDLGHLMVMKESNVGSASEVSEVPSLIISPVEEKKDVFGLNNLSRRNSVLERVRDVQQLITPKEDSEQDSDSSTLVNQSVQNDLDDHIDHHEHDHDDSINVLSSSQSINGNPSGKQAEESTEKKTSKELEKKTRNELKKETKEKTMLEKDLEMETKKRHDSMSKNHKKVANRRRRQEYYTSSATNDDEESLERVKECKKRSRCRGSKRRSRSCSCCSTPASSSRSSCLLCSSHLCRMHLDQLECHRGHRTHHSGHSSHHGHRTHHCHSTHHGHRTRYSGRSARHGHSAGYGVPGEVICKGPLNNWTGVDYKASIRSVMAMQLEWTKVFVESQQRLHNLFLQSVEDVFNPHYNRLNGEHEKLQVDRVLQHDLSEDEHQHLDVIDIEETFKDVDEDNKDSREDVVEDNKDSHEDGDIVYASDFESEN